MADNENIYIKIVYKLKDSGSSGSIKLVLKIQ
jgi:hypothetical protein